VCALAAPGLEALVREAGGEPHVDSRADQQQTIATISETRPALALLDAQMPGLDAQTVLEEIGRRDLPTRVALIASMPPTSAVYRALSLGAAGYLSFFSSPTVLREQLTALLRGGTVVSPEVVERLASEIRDHSTLAAGQLSQRHITILELASRGADNNAIGHEISISPLTVKTHLQTIYERLGVPNRAAAVAEALRCGLIE
jgi:two-component system nitrate/nitrite response regulator NarL